MTTLRTHYAPTIPAPQTWPCDRPRDEGDDEPPMTRAEVRRVAVSTTCALLGFVLALITAHGCATKHEPLDSFGDIDGAGGRIELRAEQIGDDAKAVKPRTDKVGKIHVKRIEANAEHIIEDVTTQQQASREASKAYVTLARDLDTERTAHARTVADYNGRWYVRVGQPIDRLIKWGWWLLVLIIGGGLAFRVIAMFVGGWMGATLAKVGSVGLHLLPIAGGIINQFFDNAFFRDRQFVLDAPKPAPAAVVVERPVATA